jgi:hypothetical protein
MKNVKQLPGLLLIFGCVLFSVSGLKGQDPAAEEQVPVAAEKIPTAEELKPIVSKYDGLGKRDPFMSLLSLREEDRTRLVPPPPLEERPPGLPGLLISEVSVAGVAAGNTKKIVVLKGIDGISYIAEPGSTLFDGLLKEVNEQGVVFTRTEKTTDGKSKSYKVTKPFNSSEKQVLP